MHPAAERREDADSPVADLVAEALDDDGAVGGDGAGCVGLVAQEGEQVAGGPLVEQEVGAQAVERGFVAERGELPRGGPDLLAELVRPADALALPERDCARKPRRRRNEHAVAGDLLDPPGRGAEQEGLAGAGLVDHLLVELADAAAAVDEEDAEEPAVGDRAGVRDRQPSGPVARPDRAAGAVPDDPGAKLGELVGRVAPGKHVEDVLELRARELGERVGAPDEVVQLGDLDLLVDRDRDDLLCEHIERVARDLRLLDLAVSHRAGDDGRFEQVGAELREDPPLRDGSELVPGPADPLEPAGDGLRRLDLDHEVDGAHVDPELERRGGDEARDPTCLEVFFDHDALLAREAAVMRTGDLALGELVEPEREPLGEPPVVDEEDRGAVRLDEREQLGIHRRPDRGDRMLGAAVGDLAFVQRRVVEAGAGAELAEVFDRDHDLEVELLACPGVDELDRPPPETNLPISSSGRWVAESPIRWIGVVDETLQPLDRQREVRSALRARDSVHLVEDQRLDVPQRLACRRGEHQVERLRRRDQDVGRLLHEQAAVLRRGVTRPHPDAQRRLEPGERPAEVALDVVVERFQR